MEHIKEQLSLAESQISSFDNKRTKTSATRARAHLMAVRKACDTMRKDILEQSKAHQAAKRSSGSSDSNPEVIDDTSPDEEEPETSEVSTQTVPVVEDTQQPVVIKLPKKTKKPKTKKRI